jgi:DNA-binding NarL/FixJ family response regulator
VGEPVDLAVLDVAMPRMTGVQAAAELTGRLPGLRVLMLSMYDSEQYLYEALRAGASGTCSSRRRTAISSRRAGRPCAASRFSTRPP